MAKVAWIGLGVMGYPMAGHIRKKGGHDLTVYNRNSAGNQWRRVRKQVGMDEFTLHDLRHFYASGLIASGCDVVTVQRSLGHAKATTTLNTYAHLWPTAEDRTRKAAESIMSASLGEPIAAQAKLGAGPAE